MITIRTHSNLIFLIILLFTIGITSYEIGNYVINYKTWGDNKDFFIKDYHGFEVTCDINYFASPDNCRVVDSTQNLVPRHILEPLIKEDECYSIQGKNDEIILPCIGD